MLKRGIDRPLRVGPSPEVLKAIRAEMRSRRLTAQDRRLVTIASTLAVEPVGVPGLNEGCFYAEEALPERVGRLAPSRAVRSRPTKGTLRCLPGHFCVWAKARLGWLKPTIVKRARTVKLPPIEQNKKAAYRLWTKGKAGSEYFLIEDRQLVGFDAKLPAGGLLIWHIDDSEHNNNHPGDYWVGLRQADGKRDLEMGRNRGDKGDPYPGSTHNTRFDATSNPAATDQFGSPTGVAVTNIAVTADGVVTCRVKV